MSHVCTPLKSDVFDKMPLFTQDGETSISEVCTIAKSVHVVNDRILCIRMVNATSPCTQATRFPNSFSKEEVWFVLPTFLLQNRHIVENSAREAQDIHVFLCSVSESRYWGVGRIDPDNSYSNFEF